MGTSHEQTRATLQAEIDALTSGATLQLSPGEYPGPLVIDRPLTLEGQGATIWALKGPVVFIRSDDVSLHNLNVEVTAEGWNGTAEEACAVLINSAKGSAFENVKVTGTVIGLPHEAGDWRYPHAVHLGPLLHGSEHDFSLRLFVPVPCRLGSNISGLRLEPPNLAPGKNDIRLHVDRLPQDTLLYGTLAISSAFLTRRILISAHILASKSGNAQAATGKNQVVWEPSDWATLSAVPKPAPVAPPAAPVPSATPQPPAPVSSPATPPPSLPISNVPAPPPQPAPKSVPSTPARASVRKTAGMPGELFSTPVNATVPVSTTPENTSLESTPAPPQDQAAGTVAQKPLARNLSSVRAIKSVPISSVFEKKPGADQSEQARPRENPFQEKQPARPAAKRKKADSQNISKVFGGGAKTEPQDEEKKP